ncbi:hypothetical protein TRFO_30353 [Tritrichomonas foetus]|uniref:Uncharacterized protein n=1 Tax=Tritrichomonas foetus TaxID=1144522 RepID=A0A1J4JZ30_9EUKA|nr:hypothetical protein TRFO_30353 [Tritrichomonas foetus]|eukprot:OHT02517.1 hypothetical protein TRFO_30353 [Tritrichomonas foetus]
MNAIPNPTTCTSKINEEDDAADREEYRLANLEYLHWMEEEEEAAERARRKKRMRRVSPKKQIEPPSDSLENSEINEVPNEDEIPQTPPFGNVEETTKVDTSLQDSEIKERDVNINSSDSGSEKGKKRKYRKEVAEQKVPEHSKKHTFILIACIAFVLGFVLPLFYYIHTGEIHDAKSFFYVVRTTLFGLNYTEKCMLDPECRRKTEQMLLDAEESKRLAEETKRKAQEDLERQQKEYLEKEALLKEKRKLKKEERRRIEEERRAEEERQIKKLKMLALSKDPETRDQWIKTELKKLSGDLKSIVDEQDEMSERLSHMKTEFDLEDEPESENEE